MSTKRYVTVSVAASKMGVVLHQEWSESQWILLLGYWDILILLSQQMLDAIIVSFIRTLSLSKTVHWCISRSTQSNCCSARL